MQGVASRDYTPEPVTVEEQCRNGLMSSLSMKLWLRLRRIILGIDGSFDCQMDLVKYTTQLKGEVSISARLCRSSLAVGSGCGGHLHA